MAMTPAQLETFLNDKTTQIGKISAEQAARFDAVVAANKVLQDLLNAGGTITPAIETAAGNLGSAISTLDDSIPDAVPTLPPQPGA